MREYLDAILSRRSIYAIGGESPVSNKALEEMLGRLVKHLPTAFNMQGTRLVLLLGQNHARLWNGIVLDTLRQEVDAAQLPKTQKKMAGFAAGHGTLLFFNDDDVTRKYGEENPLYAGQFAAWAVQQNGMLQLAAWVLLEEQGLGASLQHYNPLIDEAVKNEWALPQSWSLLAQMPFGIKLGDAAEKTFLPLEERFKVFN